MNNVNSQIELYSQIKKASLSFRGLINAPSSAMTILTETTKIHDAKTPSPNFFIVSLRLKYLA